MFDTTGKVNLFSKTADSTTYVLKGAADIGIIGKDTLMEEQPDVMNSSILIREMPTCSVWICGQRMKENCNRGDGPY